MPAQNNDPVMKHFKLKKNPSIINSRHLKSGVPAFWELGLFNIFYSLQLQMEKYNNWISNDDLIVPIC